MGVDSIGVRVSDTAYALATNAVVMKLTTLSSTSVGPKTAQALAAAGLTTVSMLEFLTAEAVHENELRLAVPSCHGR